MKQMSRVPDCVSFLHFSHLREVHPLAEKILAAVNATLTDTGWLLREITMVDATLTAALSSTKNSTGERDPEMRQTKRCN